MWRFKPFMPKEQTGLDGRMIDVGKLKIHIRNAIAEGGFSCVYLACDAINGSKQYALKHIICSDDESLELVMKEVTVMKSLRGHPNIVTLCAHTILDMGRTKEAFLVMEYCEKSLVNVLESRGAGYFEEKQVLLMFRDICNAVFAMHCQSPPIAHRDLKAENLLLSSDGVWKLCDFGSTSTNHKRFEKPEEMGIEEDNIRKYTTPAYRAPEMWDMFLKEVISEKVDIWALGCLLFRICYFKSAFDGESKLQILNGNYRIPELPKYSSPVTDLIRDMLHASPDARPDITQVWFRVNGLLPDGLQKSLPDRPPEMHQVDTHEGVPKPLLKTGPAPRRSPPPPPTNVESASRTSGGGGQLGAFWTSQHGKDSFGVDDTVRPKFDEEPSNQSSSKQERNHSERLSLHKEEVVQPHHAQKNVHGKSVNRFDDGHSKDFEINFFHDGSERAAERPRTSRSDNAPAFQNDGFNAFVTDFGANSMPSPGRNNAKSGKEELLEVEVERLKEQLKQTNVEKSEITSKYEKLSAICRSQRQEIQELKQALASRTPSPNRVVSKPQPSPSVQQSSPNPPKKVDGTVWELQQGLFEKRSPSPDSNSWQAFPEDSMATAATTTMNNTRKSVRTRNGQQGKQASDQVTSSWGFDSESFTAVPTSSSQVGKTVTGGLNYPQRFGETKKVESKSASQPAGWAGF